MTLDFQQFQPRTIDAVQITRRDQLDEAFTALIYHRPPLPADDPPSYEIKTYSQGDPNHFVSAQTPYSGIVVRPGDMLVRRYDPHYDNGKYEIWHIADMVSDWEPTDPNSDWPGR